MGYINILSHACPELVNVVFNVDRVFFSLETLEISSGNFQLHVKLK